MLQGQMPATDYLSAAKDGTLTFAMIETPEALENVEVIAATPGIDALFIGPYDLSTALSGGKAQDIEAPAVNAAIDKICAAAIKAGKIPGIYCRDAQRALDMAKRGFRFMTVGSDFSLVREGSAAALKKLPVKASGAKDAF
jgi:4-hydroxy-2-oxoheptanedioate aldolase